MKRTAALLSLVLAAAPGCAALGCAADRSPGKQAGGAHVRCRSVLETRPGPGGFGTQTVPVQKCEPVTPGTVGSGADLTKEPLDPAAVTEEPR